MKDHCKTCNDVTGELIFCCVACSNEYYLAKLQEKFSNRLVDYHGNPIEEKEEEKDLSRHNMTYKDHLEKAGIDSDDGKDWGYGVDVKRSKIRTGKKWASSF